MDLTNSPTIWALGSMVRLPRLMRWPSRRRSASSSLISVCDSSSFGWLMPTLLLPGIVPVMTSSSRLLAEDRPGGQAERASDLSARELLALGGPRPQHLDAAALRGDLEAAVDHVGDLADLAHDVGEAAEEVLARVEELELLAVERGPRAGCGIAAPDQVVGGVDVVSPVHAGFALAAPPFVARPRLVLHRLPVLAREHQTGRLQPCFDAQGE